MKKSVIFFLRYIFFYNFFVQHDFAHNCFNKNIETNKHRLLSLITFFIVLIIDAGRQTKNCEHDDENFKIIEQNQPERARKQNNVRKNGIVII